jgi:branched-chain amino acid transport system substrate-binding protein
MLTKRWIATFVSVVAILSLLAACGPTPTPEVVEKVVKETVVVEKEVEVTKVVEKEVEVEVAVTPTPPPARPTIKIGGQAVMSGAHADYGRQMVMGATLAIEEINAAGGVDVGGVAHDFELIGFLDSRLNADQGVANARKLVEQGADFMVGTDSSGVSLAIGPVLAELDTLQIFAHAATEKLTEGLVYAEGNKHIFRISVPVYQDAILPALIFCDPAKYPDLKVYGSMMANYEYGKTSWSMFIEKCSQMRDDATFLEPQPIPFFTADFTPFLSALMAQGPDFVLATPWAGEAVAMLRQASAQGVFGDEEGQGGVDIWWQAMGGSVDALEGITREVQQDKFHGKLWGTARYIHNWPDTEQNNAFVANFRQRWGNRYPNYSAETTYSAIYALKAAIEKAGSIETAAVIEALEGLCIQNPGGERCFRPEDHQAIYNVPAGQVVWDDNYEIATLGTLVVFDAEDYYRTPPFPEIPSYEER